MGGIKTPPVDAQASTPEAYSFVNPMRRIAGMDNGPVVRTLLIGPPLIDPIRPLEKIETFAGPPRKCPRRAKAKFIKNGPPPVNCNDTPKIKNPKTSCTNTRIGIPNKLSSPKT